MFTIYELVKATNAFLTQGSADTSVRGVSIDSRTIKPHEAFIAVKGNNFDGHDFIDAALDKGARCIIYQSHRLARRQSGVAFLQVKDTIKALGDIARSLRRKYAIPVIAVTGSNGKTTTKEMIASVLSAKYRVLKNEGTQNNHIGLPLTLLKLNVSFDSCVLELGTNHPGEIAYLSSIAEPNMAVITNIGPSHLEYFKELKHVFQEKTSLLKNLAAPGIALVNFGDTRLHTLAKGKGVKCALFGYGITHKADFVGHHIKRTDEHIKFLVNKNNKVTLHALGLHNVHNALAAVAVGRMFGLGYKSISDALAHFTFPSNRLVIFKTKRTKFINDTYNANPFSLEGALEALRNTSAKGRKIFVMGDMLELGEKKEFFHRQAGLRVARVCDVFITVGELSKAAAKEAGMRGFNERNLFTCATSRQARKILFETVAAGPRDIVLVKGSRSMMMEEVLKEE